MPSRAHTKPTPARRTTWGSAEITERAGSQRPRGMQRTHAAGNRPEAPPPEPRCRDHFRKGRRFWKVPDRFDQISVGFRVADDRPAERWDHVEGIKIVERVEPGHIDVGKFETEKAAAGPQHAEELGKSAIDARHVADAECDGAGIEVPVRKRQALGIARHEAHAAFEPASRGAFATDGKHFLIDVANRDPAARAPRLRHAEPDVPTAAGHIP